MEKKKKTKRNKRAAKENTNKTYPHEGENGSETSTISLEASSIPTNMVVAGADGDAAASDSEDFVLVLSPIKDECSMKLQHKEKNDNEYLKSQLDKLLEKFEAVTQHITELGHEQALIKDRIVQIVERVEQIEKKCSNSH